MGTDEKVIVKDYETESNRHDIEFLFVRKDETIDILSSGKRGEPGRP